MSSENGSNDYGDHPLRNMNIPEKFHPYFIELIDYLNSSIDSFTFNQLYKELKKIIIPHSITDKESVSLRGYLISFLVHSLINKKILVPDGGFDIRKTNDIKKIMNNKFDTYVAISIKKYFRYVGNNFVSLREVLINNLEENPENFSNWWELFRFYDARYLRAEACEVWFLMEEQFGFDVINNLSYNEIKQISNMLIYHVDSMLEVRINQLNNDQKFVTMDNSKELEYLIRGSHLANLLQEKGFTRRQWSGRFYQIRNYDSKEIISIHFHALNAIYKHFRKKIRLMLVEQDVWPYPLEAPKVIRDTGINQKTGKPKAPRYHIVDTVPGQERKKPVFKVPDATARTDGGELADSGDGLPKFQESLEDFLPKDEPIFELEPVLFERLKNFHEFYRILDNNSEEEF